MPENPAPTHLPRRDLFRAGALGLATAGLAAIPAAAPAVPLPSPDPAAPSDPMTIDQVDVIPVKVPFREVVARNMARELPHWQYVEVIRIKLRSGHVGHGETLSFYTWGRTTAEDLQRVKGRNAASLMWDDSLGAGLQIALFDAVARAAGVPIHRLLGTKIRDRVPMSWWAIDMPPADWASECQDALKLGYTAFKTKGRPWFDIREQVHAVAAVVPESFKLDMDFNDTLLDAGRAIPILKELEADPRIGIYETPIPQSDVEGNKAIRAAVRTPISLHYGTPEPVVVIREQVCDGFVIGGGARRVMEDGTVAAMAGMPFWLQLVGTGITAAFSIQLGAVLRQATWPAVNCHQLYTHMLLKDPIAVADGTSAVPEAPGLGYEVDDQALRRFAADVPRDRPEPERLLEVSWPGHRPMYVASDGEVNFILRAGMEGKIPYFRDGAMTRLVPDDGGARWRTLYDRARKDGPFVADE